jgi:hypothetical protein
MINQMNLDKQNENVVILFNYTLSYIQTRLTFLRTQVEHIKNYPDIYRLETLRYFEGAISELEAIQKIVWKP